MIDGAASLFGQEWSDVQGTGRVSFLLSAAPFSPAVPATRLPFALTRKYQPLLRLALTLAKFPSLLIFLQGWRSYLGMRKD